jgi:glycine cleavage system H protein
MRAEVKHRGEKEMAYPLDYRYTKEHLWIKQDGDIGAIGITEYAQYSLGEIVFFDVPAVGAQVQADQSFGTVESVKSVSDLYAPASGVVTEVNSVLLETPEKVNADAHGSWIIKIKLSSAAPVEGLLTAGQYEQYLKDEDKEIH